jgi:hypothetical protein
MHKAETLTQQMHCEKFDKFWVNNAKLEEIKKKGKLII